MPRVLPSVQYSPRRKKEGRVHPIQYASHTMTAAERRYKNRKVHVHENLHISNHVQIHMHIHIHLNFHLHIRSH